MAGETAGFAGSSFVAVQRWVHDFASFDPEAFVLRRSMPWAEGPRAGLVFVAFGRSFDAFEAQLGRMVGVEDGTSDALFRFTRPLSGACFWCPPMSDAGRIDFGASPQ